MIKKTLILILISLFVLPVVNAQVNPIVEFNPSNTDTMFEEGRSQRVCYVGGLAAGQQINDFSYTTPSGNTTSAIVDSEGCISFLMSEEGLWTLDVVITGSLGNIVSDNSVNFYVYENFSPEAKHFTFLQNYYIYAFLFAVFCFMIILSEWKQDTIYYILTAVTGIFTVIELPDNFIVPRIVIVALVAWIVAQAVRVNVSVKREGY